MKLVSITTKDFKKIGNFSAQFTDGLNIIIGENWAGKSTLLQAIVTALYGTQVLPGKKEDFPTWGQKNFSVELTLEHLDVTYKITRDMKNAKVEGAAGDLLASGNTTVTKFIEETLGLQFKDFALFVLSQQGETAGVMTFGATALQQRVEAFSGAELLDEVLGKVRAETAFLTRSVGAEDVTTLGADLDAAKAGLITAETELTAAKSSYAELQDCLASELERAKRLDAFRIDVINACNRVDVYKAKLDRRNDALTLAKGGQSILAADLESTPAFVNVTQAEEVLQQATDIRKADSKELTRFNDAVKAKARLERELPELQRLTDDSKVADAELEKLRPVFDKAIELKAQFAADVKEANAALAAARTEAATGVCKSCNRPHENFDPKAAAEKVAKAENESIAMQAGAAECAKSTTALSDEVKLLESRIDRNLTRRLANKLQEVSEQEDIIRGITNPEELERNIAANTEVIAESSRTISQAEITNAQRTKLVNRLSAADTEVLELTKEVSDTLEEYHAVLEERTQLAGSNPELAKVNASKACTAQAAYLQELQVKHTHAAELVANAAFDVTLNKKQAEQLTDQVEALKEQTVSLDKHKRLTKYLTESRNSYMKKVWDQILGMASRTLATATGGDLTRVLRDDKGQFIAEEGGKFVPVANCSGAQKGFIGVALRVGLSSALYGNTGLLILDEPTADMNDARALQLSGALMGLSGQCITITHRQFEQLAAQNVIQVN